MSTNTKSPENQVESGNLVKPVLANRLLKFRAWVEEQKRMIKVFGFNEHLFFEQTWDSPSIKENIFEIEDCHIMQFTGFTDKKEVEIFEDDILEIVNNEGKTLIGNVKWNEDRGCYEVISRYNGKLYDRIWLDKTKAHFSKILGNIHHNMDVLQTTS